MNLRSKIVSLGLSAVTAGTVAFTAAAPAAHASVVSDMCAALPGQLATANANAASAGATASFTASDVANKSAALNTAVNTFVTNVNGLLSAILGDLDTTVPGAALNVSQTDLVNKIVAWANADAANFQAQEALRSAMVNQQILSGVLNGVCATLP
jgi:hypothetical protein